MSQQNFYRVLTYARELPLDERLLLVKVLLDALVDMPSASVASGSMHLPERQGHPDPQRWLDGLRSARVAV